MKSAPILHVEDSEDDRFFLERALRSVGVANEIQAARDGAAAMEYLSGEGEYADRRRYPLPCLVMLDLKLPKVEGLEGLRWVRGREGLKGLVVVIFSSSPLRNDVDIAYELGANSFIVKPLTNEHLTRIARVIKQYWLESNEFHTVCHGRPGEQEPGIKASGEGRGVRGRRVAVFHKVRPGWTQSGRGAVPRSHS